MAQVMPSPTNVPIPDNDNYVASILLSRLLALLSALKEPKVAKDEPRGEYVASGWKAGQRALSPAHEVFGEIQRVKDGLGFTV